MKKFLVFGLASMVSFVMVMQVSASPTKRYDETTKSCRSFDQDSFWWGSGAQTFWKTCKPCHTREGEGGFIHVESKTSRAWNRVFFEKYPQCAKDGHWDSLTMDDILKLNDYLYRFGAFTYNPNDANDCG